MKKLQVVFAALLVMMALVGMAAAFSQDITVQSSDGGIAKSFSMSIAPGAPVMSLIIGENLKDGPEVTVSSNTEYTISVKDNMAGTKPPASAGKMCAINPTLGTWYGTGLGDFFMTALNGGAYYPTSAADQTIRSGVPESFTGALKFKQIVFATDPVLPTGNVYQIGLTVTGSATP